MAQLKDSDLKNATEALVRGFIDQLVFGYLTEGDPLLYKFQVVAAINASFELYPGIVEDRLRKQLNKVIRDVPDIHFDGACSLVVNVRAAWGLLEQTSKDKVIRFIENGPVNEVLRGLEVLSKFDELKPAILIRANNLEFNNLVDAINSYGFRELAKERSLLFLSEAYSWDRANVVFDQAVLPLFSFLTVQDIERIIRMPNETGADLPGSHGFRLFIDNVRKAGTFEEAALNTLLMNNGGGYLVPQAQRPPVEDVDLFDTAGS